MNDNKIRAFCDTETTGLDFANDRIVEFGAVICRGREIIDTHKILINPEIKIPYEASQVHNIYDKDVVNAPKFKDVYKDIIDILVGVETCIFHNADYDTTMLSQEFSRLSKKNNITDYIKNTHPNFIAERDRIYLMNDDNQYNYTGTAIKDSNRQDYGMIDLFPIEDTLRVSFNFYDLHSNKLDTLIKLLLKPEEAETRAEFHGALIDSELLMKCYFKMKDTVLKDYDFVDISRNLNGGNFKKNVVNPNDLVDETIANKAIKFNPTEEQKEVNINNSVSTPKMKP